MGARTALPSASPSGGRGRGAHPGSVGEPRGNPSREFLRQRQTVTGHSAHGAHFQFLAFGEWALAQVSTACVGERAPHSRNREGDRHWCRVCEAAVLSPRPQALKPESFGSLEGRGADPPDIWCPRGKPVPGGSGGPGSWANIAREAALPTMSRWHSVFEA